MKGIHIEQCWDDSGDGSARKQNRGWKVHERENAVCSLLKTCWVWIACGALQGSHAVYVNMGANASGDREHQGSHKQTEHSMRHVWMGSPRGGGERTKEKGMEQEIMGNSRFFQRGSIGKEAIKGSWMEEKEQGKWCHRRWADREFQNKELPIALTTMYKSRRTEAKKPQSWTSGVTGRRKQQAKVTPSSGLALSKDMTWHNGNLLSSRVAGGQKMDLNIRQGPNVQWSSQKAGVSVLKLSMKSWRPSAEGHHTHFSISMVQFPK